LVKRKYRNKKTIFINSTKMIPNFKEPEFKQILLFELKSFIGRKFFKRKSKFPLRCPDSICDGCYSSHTLEHLYPDKAYKLLNEIYRILKPGCWLRIVLPDIKRSVDFYNGKIKITEYTFGAEAISNCTQNWGHHSTWDEELLTYALKSVGFTNIKNVKYGEEGSDKRLIKELDSRKSESFVMEAQKPL